MNFVIRMLLYQRFAINMALNRCLIFPISVEKVIKEYAKEDISQEKINDLLDQLNGSRDGGSR